MKYDLKDLVDIQKLQELCERLYDTVKIPNAIVAMDGEILTKSGWQRICTHFHRPHPEIEKDCIKSDTLIRKVKKDDPFCVYTCPRGLTDASTPIMIEGEHVANAFVGQVLLDLPGKKTENFFKEQAQRFGLDEDAYIEAFREVPVIAPEKFHTALKFLTHLAQMIAELGLQRKRELDAQQELKQSKELYQLLIDNQNDLVVQFDNEKRITFASPSYCKMFGKSEKELLGRTFLVLIDEDDLPIVKKSLEALSMPPHKTQHEERALTVNGWRWFSWSAKAIISDDGNIKSIVSVGRDITDRKNAQNALLKSEKNLSALIENTDGIIWSVDKDYRFLVGNTAFHKIMSNWRQDPFKPGDNLLSNEFSQEHLDEWRGYYNRAMSGENFSIERKAIDNKRYHEYRFNPIFSVDGKTEGVTVFGRDITDYKNSKRRIEDSESQKRAILNGISSSVALVNTNLEILWVNKTAADSVGKIPDEMIGKKCHNFWGDPKKPCENCPTVRAIKSKKSEQSLVKSPDGRVWDEKGEPVFDDNGELIGVVEIANDITEQKRTRDALAQSEKNFRSYVENAPYGVFIGDEKGNFLQVNKAACEIAGYSEPELLSMSIANTVSDDQRELVAEKYKVLIKTGKFSGEIPFLSKDGRDNYWKIDVVRLSETRYLGFAQDITERKQAEEALRQSEAHHRTLIETIPDLIWLKDPDGIYLSCNHAFETFFGAKEEEIIGKTDYDFVDKDLADFFRKHDRKAMEANGPNMNEEWLTFADTGYHGLFETIKSPMRDADGNLIGVLGVARDITDRKKTEDELRESEEKYRSLVEGSIQGVVIAQDNPLRLSFANSAMADITGYEVGELLSMDPEQLSRLIYEEDRELFISNFRKRLAGENPPEQSEYRFLTKMGQVRWVQSHSSLIKYFGSQATLTIFIDITDLKKAEEEKVMLEEQLHQSQKMESIGRLAGGVAHDFNNLLTGITGYSEIVLNNLEPGDPIRADIQEIQNAGDRAAKLTAQLLAFSRKQVISPRIVAPNDILERANNMLRRIIGEDIEFVYKPARGLGRIKVDPSQLDQIFINLAVNARDAMPNGGRLVVQTKNITVDEKFCASHIDASVGDYVMVEVADNGSGMEKEVLENIFEPFFSTKGKDRGTGLGLATVYGIVKQHNGFITVDSEPGKGSVFRVYFPRVDEHVDELIQSPETDLPRGNETILLVEDEQMVRRLATRVLENQGYHVIVAENGGEAFIKFEEQGDDIDLLLTDVIMPNMNGSELFKRLKEMKPDLKSLFMSGYTEDAIAHHGVLDNKTNFIQKPFRPKELSIKVRQVLDTD